MSMKYVVDVIGNHFSFENLLPFKMSEEPIARIKLLTIGDSMVGKSCIVKRFCEKKV